MRALVVVTILVGALASAAARAASIEGTVREKATRRPIPGAFVGVVQTDVATFTDEQGQFVLDFEETQLTSATIEVETSGYARLVQVVTLRGDRSTTTVDLYLAATEGAETQVRERRSKDNIARGAHRIEGTEVNELPGTYGDPAKAIENFPGMGRVLLSQGSLFIRGATPNQSAIFVDDYEIPDLYHYTGSTSVINIPFVESVELVPGAFSARYGRSVGGVVVLKTKKLPTDDIHGFAKLDVIDGGAYVGVPVSDGIAVGASARRSYLDVIRNVQKATVGTGDTVLLTPTYWDYQLKLDWDSGNQTAGANERQLAFGLVPTAQLPAGHELVLFAFGSGDRELYESDGSGALDPYLRTNDSDFHRVSLRYQHNLGAGFTHTFTPVIGYARSTLQEQGGLRYANRDTYDAQLRDEITWRTGVSRVVVGIDATARWDDLEYGGFLADDGARELASPSLATIAGSERERTHTWRLTGGLYLEGTLEPLTDVSVTPGVRVETYMLEGEPHFSLEPRFAGSWTIQPGAWATVVKMGAGAFSRPPEPDDLAAARTNGDDLSPESALHMQGGVEQNVADAVTFSATLFNIWRDEITTRARTFPVPERAGVAAVVGGGSGQSTGVELLARAGAPKKYYAWVTYALARNVRTDGSRAEEQRLGVPYTYASNFDTTHAASAVGQVWLWWGFRVGARYRIATGMPNNTDVAGAVFDADTGRYEPVPAPRGNTRYPLFQAFDLRIDWAHAFDWFELDIYADLANLNTVVFGRPQEATYYGYDFSQTEPHYGVPLVPAIGAKATF